MLDVVEIASAQDRIYFVGVDQQNIYATLSSNGTTPD